MEPVTASYKRLSEIYEADYRDLTRRTNGMSLLRLLTAILSLVCTYYYIQYKNLYLLAAAITGAAIFLLLMKLQKNLSWKKTLKKHLVNINRQEEDFVESGKLFAENGAEYIDPAHPYTADLDIFGNRSLFQFLNRTTTYTGKTTLAQMLSASLSANRIRENQEAIAEAAHSLETRQELMAIGYIARDSKATFEQLIRWTREPGQKIHTAVIICCHILTAVLCLSVIAYIFSGNEVFSNIASRVFPVNLILFFTQVKKIRKELFKGIKIDEVLKSYGLMLQHIRAASYKSSRLQELQGTIRDTEAGRKIQQLSKLYANLETMENPFAMVIMNGLYFFHIHQLNKVSDWKHKYAADIEIWLQVIGELEAINSLGNMYYNNPSFCFPELNDRYIIHFEELGHPLISAKQRITNSISFARHSFVILTGSNMSGKSTFLRTLGINMVLAGTGAPVCAAKAAVHPLPVWVSMRQSDSLADNESYFFAEVKRLGSIIKSLEQQPCFILLDEILRGTNSDDKRNGTISVIKNMIAKKALGIIATHDLEVCLVQEQYPDILVNKCFEVSIANNELKFDYRLRDGICKNKSATFLMQKMGII